jgi:hypothetical protein
MQCDAFVATVCLRPTARDEPNLAGFDGKKAETAPSTMTFYRTSLAKFLQSSGNDQIRDILPRVSGITQVGSVGSLRKK